MGFSRKQLQGLATGLQLIGVVAQSLDPDTKGADDTLGRSAQTAGLALGQLAAGDSVTKKGRAAEALRAVASALNSVADEVEG
jgi:hypothetical protein